MGLIFCFDLIASNLFFRGEGMFDRREDCLPEGMKSQVFGPFEGHASSRSLQVRWTRYLPTSCALSNITLE